ncbi:MAG: LysR substrate-binding domain-containing protein [Galactobacter sp.]
MADLDVKLLQAFVVLAEEMHFTRAAERLGVAQPVISQRIRRLEIIVGASLFDRGRQGASLTASGRAALAPAKRAVRASRQVIRAAQLEGKPVLGSVNLGYAGASSRPWLPPIARAVRNEAPGIELKLRSMVYAGSARSLVATGELDMAFSRKNAAHRDLDERIFEYERVMLALSTDHPLAGQSSVGLEQVRDDSWVTFPDVQGSSVREIGFRLARQAGFTPHVAQEAPDSYTILGLVAAGVGISVTVSSVAHIDTPGMVLVPLSGPPKYLAATIITSQRPTRATRFVRDIVETVLPTPSRPSGLVLGDET